MPRLAAFLVATTCLSALPLSAQEGAPGPARIGWLDLFAPQMLAQRLVQTGVMALRSQMDLQYGDLALDLRLGQATMTDIAAWPFPEWDTAGECAIFVDRLVLRSAAVDDPDTVRMKLQASGVSAEAACLPPDARMPLQMLGQSALSLPRVTIDMVYDVPSAGARVNLYTEVEGALTANLTADFSYLWVDASDPDQPVPVMFLRSAALAVENHGAWAALSGQMPPPFTDPAQAGQVVSAMLGQGLAQMNSDGSGGVGLSEAQQAFVDSVAEAWPAFLESPRRLVVETRIAEEEAYLDVLAYEDSPQQLFDDLRPQLSLAAAAARTALPAATLGKVLEAVKGGTAGELPQDELLAVGLALLEGRGAPRDRATGETALAPLAEAGHGAAALALSAALEPHRPEAAYRYAMIAGAAGETGATARLDRLETRLPLTRVLELQGEVVGKVQHPVEALEDVALMRDHALARHAGRGALRSYSIAALWATLGAAAGDAESADILAALDERIRLAGPEAAKAWAGVEAEIAALALDAWVGMDLPARFGTP